MAHTALPAVSNAAISFPVDFISPYYFSRVKLAFGVEGAATDVSASAPLPVTGAVSVTGTVTTTLGAGLPAGTNNIGDVDVLTMPTVATTTRAYDFASGLSISGATATARVGPVTATEVMLSSSTDCYFRVGDVTVAATAGAGSVFLAAGVPFHLRITSGQYVAAIRATADGTCSVMPVA